MSIDTPPKNDFYLFNEVDVFNLIRLIESNASNIELIKVFKSYQWHKDFFRMSNEYSALKSNNNFNLNTRMLLLEVLYPIIDEPTQNLEEILI